MRYPEIYEQYKNGVIMDVTTGEEAKIAEEAGAVAVMALEKVPADIRKEGGVARTASVQKIKEILDSVDIPVMAKARIGHRKEARLLEELGVDFVDESEVLTPADEHHVDKDGFELPFVCGARDLGEALRRIEEGARMVRTKGEAGTGDVNQAVKHMRRIRREIGELVGLHDLGKYYAKRKIENMHKLIRRRAQEYRVSPSLIHEVAEKKKLPVPNYAAGGIATPADAAWMMKLGADGVFVGSGVFKSEDPEERGKAIVKAVRNWQDSSKLLEASSGLKRGMEGISADSLEEEERMQHRGD